MTTRWPVVFVTTLCCLLPLATAVFGGVVSGNEWRKLSPGERKAYVIGVVDGWQPVDAVIEERARKLPVGVFALVVSCVQSRSMTGEQMFALVEKYMAAHPEEWHKSMAYLVYFAMVGGCK